MNNFEIFTSAFFGIAALVPLAVLTIAAAIMPLYVISICSTIKKIRTEQATANERQALLLNRINATLSRMETVEVITEN